jgi:phage baseplate assembly protein W
MTSFSEKQTPTINTGIVYSDFFSNFFAHPETQQLTRVINYDAVKRSIRNLINTDRGERIFNPSIGSNVRKMLFEQATNDNAFLLKEYITETITNYEPRANLIDVTVKVDEQEQQYYVDIYFNITNNEKIANLTLTLRRIR